MPERAAVLERLETWGPVAVIGTAGILDGLADRGSAMQGVALALRVAALAACAALAVRGIGRYGPGPLARRFSFWRASGLFAAAACLGLEVLIRWPILLHPTDGGFALDVVSVLWLLLTGAAWDRRSWARLVVRAEDVAPASNGRAPLWGGLGASS